VKEAPVSQACILNDSKPDRRGSEDCILAVMYDALARHRAVESIVACDTAQGQLRKYYRFRADRWYGGIAAADVVGCGLLCRFCWVSEIILERPDAAGEFLAPEAALALYIVRWPSKIKRNPKNKKSITAYDDVTMLPTIILSGLAAEPGGPATPHMSQEANMMKP